MEAEPVIKRSRLKELIALFVFLIVCSFLAMPLLTLGGEDSSRGKAILVFLVFCRLAWQIYKRTFRFRDFFVYFAVVIAFCIWMDSHL